MEQAASSFTAVLPFDAVELGELEGLRYRCLDGCGYCCTFTPEVSGPELAQLRTKLPSLPVTRSGGMLLLQFQGACGACTLLKELRCTQYEDRPAHCRYFPFHLYFGRRTEAYVNRCCRGVEVAPGSNLGAEFKAQVTDLVPPYRVAKEQARAAAAHEAFERAARNAGMWGAVDEESAVNLERGTALFQPAAWPPTPTGEADEAGSPSEAWQLALAPFRQEDPVGRPFHLTGELEWLGFQAQKDHVVVQTLRPSGTLETRQDLGDFPGWPELPPPVQRDLFHVLKRLAGRDVMAGSIYFLVDQSGYEISVADATTIRFGDVAADLALRAEILHRLGVPWSAVGAEAERFYDPAFLDSPTIGAWL
ncbi:MAG: YkgJ family cysteine cluster protein [Thermoplasmatota archaeon]